jgi:ATP-dependent DNA helicase RecG
MYGDLDLTLLDESPAGRKPIITELVLPNGREAVYEKVRRELADGRQAYVICPRIDEPDPDKELALNAKSVKEEAKRLKKSVFPEYTIEILHSKMPPKDKDNVMADFKDGKTKILCATSVVEVGVNVPNATVILIEGAERFGLAQLHQLRGRVMRSSYQTYCYAFTETNSVKSIERLKALQNAKNGFELAELDLAQRGSGALAGMRQWGVSDIAMEALKNLKMVEAARTEAVRLIEEDSDLSRYPELRKEVAERKKDMHFE